jgi:amidase
MTRRTFLGATAAGTGAMLAGGLPFGTLSAAAESGDAIWIEKTIPQLQALMASGALTSLELTRGYLKRVKELNPLLHAVIETNPEAEAIAARLDAERRKTGVRGPLHGIPILVKDNIATNDTMQTTAGSLALVNSRVPADAAIVTRLRRAGAVILGKANLSEWANFRGFAPLDFNGWSARGGKTRDPYLLSFDPCGSSAGSAVAPAANLCAAAVGTETDGSIVCPATNNLVVGLKPTLGLLSQDGIIPIAHSQDTAGPIARTVTDVAILLGAMQSPFGPVLGRTVPSDYIAFLDKNSLAGKTIGVDERYLTEAYFGHTEITAVFDQGLAALEALGATVVSCDSGDIFAYGPDEFTVLLMEFKVQIAQYLGGLTHTSMRTLSDLIAFNTSHCQAEMPYYGQELFEMSDSTSGDLTDPAYLAARANCLLLSRTNGIDQVLSSGIDAIVAPSYTFASQPAAVAGYPNIAIPIGFTSDGKPAGMWMYAGFLQEPKLLAFAYALEQALQPRTAPRYVGSLQPFPPNPGVCSALVQPPHIFNGKAHQGYNLGTGRVVGRRG